MDPNNPIFNNNSPTYTPNPQPPINPMPTPMQGAPTVPFSESPQQPLAVSQPYNVNGQTGQNIPKTPRYVGVLTKICLVLGIITTVATVFTIIGLVSGLFSSNRDVAMSSGLLLGTIYTSITQYGTILCIATLIAIFVAKRDNHISIKKPLITTICSLLMIYLPLIIIQMVRLIAK